MVRSDAEIAPSNPSPASSGNEHVTPGSIAASIDATFQRIGVRMEDLLSSVEDSARLIQPTLESQVKVVLSNLSTKLQAAGLGVFATKAVSITRDEVTGGLSAEGILSPIFDTIAECRAEIEDIISKASTGTVKMAASSTRGLQARVIQLYAALNEREQELGQSNLEIRQLRAKVNEIQNELENKTKQLDMSNSDKDILRQSIADLEAKLEERNQTVSEIRGELSEAISRVEEQQKLIDKLDSAEELVTDYESNLAELSEIRGRVSTLEENLQQREEIIESLREETSQLLGAKTEMETRLEESFHSISVLQGQKISAESDIDLLKQEISELKARWDTLYQVAEDEPAFKAYFVIADKKHWFPLSHLSSALGIPVVRLKGQLQRFVDAGLLEIDDENVRPVSLSEVAREAAEAEDRIIEDAQSSIETNGPDSDDDDTDMGSNVKAEDSG